MYISLFTAQVTIQTDAGPITGELGSKQPFDQTVCQGMIGQPIVVESTSSPHGMKFKKINPQYAPTTDRPYGQQPPPVSSSVPANKDIYIMRQCAAKVVAELSQVVDAALDQQFADECNRLVKYFQTGIMPPTKAQFDDQYNKNPTAKEDDIPQGNDDPPF